ncbi:ATP-binding protein [Coxiella endosymbiont of Dermacentor marginatus]|uniref:ATP-binding protein n=1 Tax=Coxiella endosymbiont of Dermacentor marginatus TaxID=1656159 RepID=UPI0022225765|nr:ATP-binding protein [Coxiella endosymbiont of Dermacentor marginatus]
MKQSNKLNLKPLPMLVKEHVNQLERIQRYFVVNFSHKRRVSLTIIRSYLKTFLKKKHPGIKPYQKIFSRTYQYSAHIEVTIYNLLSSYCLEGDSYLPEEKVNVFGSKILKIFCSDTKKISGEKQHSIKLKTDTNVYISKSEKEFKSLFSSIIMNAVEYTLTKGCIHIKWCLDNDYSIFMISNTVIGITKEHILRITKRFYRLNKLCSHESNGIGFGLAIVKHVLIRYQGDACIRNKPGKGSIFTCCFSHKNRILSSLIDPETKKWSSNRHNHSLLWSLLKSQ